MKEIRRLINHLVGCAVAFAMVSTLSAQTMGSAKVIRIKGPARYTPGITFGSLLGWEWFCSPGLSCRPVRKKVRTWIWFWATKMPPLFSQ